MGCRARWRASEIIGFEGEPDEIIVLVYNQVVSRRSSCSAGWCSGGQTEMRPAYESDLDRDRCSSEKVVFSELGLFTSYTRL